MTAPTPHLATFRRSLLHEAATRLDTDLIWERRAVQGARPTMGMPTGRGTWARITWHRAGEIFPREFSGLEASTAIHGVPKPSFIQTIHWPKDGFICRTEEMTFVDAAPVSTAYVVDQVPDVTDAWWEDLSSALDNLAATDTDRVSLVQENIDDSIIRAFGPPVDTTITRWVPGHGDLHWGNVTAPELVLLDWDSWGLIPRGLDAAKLWEASCRVPELANEVSKRFARDLSTRDGAISKLWVCANRVLGARRRGETTGQSEHAHQAGTLLLGELKG